MTTFLVLFWLTADSQDSLALKQPNVSTYLIPTTLIISGLVLNQEVVKNDFRDWIRARRTIPNTKIDDVLQHMPIAMMYFGDLASHRPSNEVMRQTRHLLVSQALTLGTVYLLKEFTKERRPNGGSRSFPSGHTSYSFASAAVFYHAFKKEWRCLAYLGYLPATITGIYRILRDKHWVSDVVLGAGLGILSSQLSYHLNIWNSATPISKQKDRIDLSLGMASSSYGVGAYLRF